MNETKSPRHAKYMAQFIRTAYDHDAKCYLHMTGEFTVTSPQWAWRGNGEQFKALKRAHPLAKTFKLLEAEEWHT